ncbi:hypothetical protein KIH23_13355 [Flavobacterium sp. CYK-55]|uniref:hypothetical protein n=1 Tax=Flavobacterium sp. CYK-55 TaxID=2835529 RepID=UPI001BD04737|nr:hypothetical protein [Flavobacterium sp. CYK-55]MBS7788289.1 hypothetical protein [Flavobacterium sp. CYK-55]
MSFLFLSNKELQTITGKGEKACYRLISKIRLKNNKDNGIPITLEEFCEYTRLKIDHVQQALRK